MASRQIFSPESETTRSNLRVKLRSDKLRSYGYPSDYYVRYLPSEQASEIIGTIQTIADQDEMSPTDQERAVKRLLCDHILCDNAGEMVFAGNYDTMYALPMSVANDMITGWMNEFSVTGVSAIPIDELSEAMRESIAEDAKKKSEPTT